MGQIIQLKKGEEYITLNNLLKVSGLISTGGEAKIFLLNNQVLVDKEIETRRGKKLYPGTEVEVLGKIFFIKSNVD